MNKIFGLRVDIETEIGIKAIPNLLDILKKLEMRASFYVIMKPPSLFQYIKYKRVPKIKPVLYLKDEFWEEKIKTEKEKFDLSHRYSKLEKLELLFQRNFIKKNLPIFERILNEGHELGLHGLRHYSWNHAIYFVDIKNYIQEAIEYFENYFRFKPRSWASPGFKINKSALIWLDNFGIKVISDLPGNKPFKVKIMEKELKIVNVPITIVGNNNLPIIEWLELNNIPDSKKIEIIKDEIRKRELSTIYMHGMFECRKKLELLEKILEFVKKNEIIVKRIIDWMK